MYFASIHTECFIGPCVNILMFAGLWGGRTLDKTKWRPRLLQTLQAAHTAASETSVPEAKILVYKLLEPLRFPIEIFCLS